MPIELGYSRKPAGEMRPPAPVAVARLMFWAVCGALAIAALGMIRNAPEVRATAQERRATEISAENRAFCEKWGMRFGTAAHTECTRDLDAIRASQEKRVAEDAVDLF